MKEEKTDGLSFDGSNGVGSGQAYVICIYGGNLGKPHHLLDKSTLGRLKENTIQINNSSISRFHAQINKMGKEFYLEDLKSTNGTSLNNEKIGAPVVLKNGDHIKVGSAVLKFISGNDVESLYHEEIYRLTIIDGLTGLHNRLYFQDFLEREISRSKRHQRPLIIAMIDIDFFKKVNDIHGHVCGDYVLNKISRILEKEVRREDLIARYGGEEFALILTETTMEEAFESCERIREQISTSVFEFDGKEISVSVSIGIAEFNENYDAEMFIKDADGHLYHAKKAGRNRLCHGGLPHLS